MRLISSVYYSKILQPGKTPPIPKQSTKRLIQHSIEFMHERRKLVGLVRANGFPECKQDASMGLMRKYLRERGIKTD